jgi:hypothetical protein
MLMKNQNYLDLTNNALLAVDPSTLNQTLNTTYEQNSTNYITYITEQYEISFDVFISGTRTSVDNFARNFLNCIELRVDYDGIYATKEIRPLSLDFSEKQYPMGTLVSITMLSLGDWLIANGTTIDLKKSGTAPMLPNDAKVYNYVYDISVYYNADASSSYTVTNSINYLLFEGNNVTGTTESLQMIANDVTITLNVPPNSTFSLDNEGSAYLNGTKTDLTSLMSNNDVYKYQQLFKQLGVQTTQFSIVGVGNFDSLTATSFTKTPWL